jgi:hypothetical protein
LHEIDIEAKDLRDAIRYSHALLSRGLISPGGCIYLNGKPRTELALTDIDPKDVDALEVYVPGTLEDNDRLPPFPIGTPCEFLWGSSAAQSSRGRAPSLGAVRNPGTAPPRHRGRGNTMIAIVIWTRGRS